MTGPTRPWYEGSSDPLDQRLDLGPGNNFADWLPGPAASPEQILCECEELDEAEGCACGTHLEEYYRRSHANHEKERSK